jgi:hypothetical protein
VGILLVLTLLVGVGGPARRGAAAPSASGVSALRWSAAIRVGDCQQLGAVVTLLTDLTVPRGPVVGQRARAIPAAASSFTVVPVPLDQLLATDDAIVVQAATPNHPVIACGALGGVIDRNGALTIGLRGHTPSEYAGIAYLTSTVDLSGTDVAVFLAPTRPTAPGQRPTG